MKYLHGLFGLRSSMAGLLFLSTETRSQSVPAKTIVWDSTTEKVPSEVYAGAPYLRQLNSGETILSYQGTEGRKHRMEFSEMKVVVGNAEATSFAGKSVPFQVPPDKCGLSNSICILQDDSIIVPTVPMHLGRTWRCGWCAADYND